MPGEFYIEGKAQKVDISQLVAAATELEDKLDSIVVYRGKTTGDGAVDGSTLVCADLAAKPDYDGDLVVVKSGAYAGQSSQINGDTTGGIVAAYTHFGGRIGSGVSFAVLGIRVDTGAVAAIEAKLDDASHGLAALKALIDAVEGKLDNGTFGLAALKALLDTLLVAVPAVGSLVDAVEGKLDDGNHGLAALKDLIDVLTASGLAYKGTVSNYTDVTHFKVSDLTGFGDNFFKNWYVYPVWKSDSSGGAPQGENQPVAAYTSADGAFEHTDFTVHLLVGDKVLLILPAVAYMLGLTPTRAGYLDKLRNLTTQIFPLHFSFLNNANEQDIIVFNPTSSEIDCEFDFSTLTQINTIREKVQTDGANYAQVSAKIFPTHFDTGTKVVETHFIQKGSFYKISMQASAPEGAVRDVPYRVSQRLMT